jgi:hypothetical protein
MKLSLDINQTHYSIILHDVHLYLEPKKQMKYLFCLNTQHYPKKYLLDINYNLFENFIKECLEIGNETLNREDWEINIIQTLEKYQYVQNDNLKIFLNKKLGNLILNNFQHKNFAYLRKIEKYFVCYSDYDYNSLQYKLNSQIKYLIILINNLVEIKTSTVRIKKTHEPINFLDFIFDYYLN